MKRNSVRRYQYKRLIPHTLASALLNDESDNEETVPSTNQYLIVLSIVIVLIFLLFGAIYFFPIREVETAFPPLSSTGRIGIGEQSPVSSSSLSSPSASFSSSSSSSVPVYHTSLSPSSPTHSSSPPPSYQSSSISPSSSIPYSQPPSFSHPNVSQSVFNPLYYTLSSSFNAVPQWASFKISPDGSTAIGCNSNCSYSLCAIFRNNTQVFSITTSLTPGVYGNLGMLGLSSISNYGQLIALGSWGCILNSDPEGFIYLFTETYFGSNVWTSVILPGNSGSPIIATYGHGLSNTGHIPSGIFHVSSDGTKLVFLNYINTLSIQTFYLTLTATTYTSITLAISTSSFSTSSVLSYDGNTLFVTNGFIIECCSSACFGQIFWFQWSGSNWNQIIDPNKGSIFQCNPPMPIGIEYLYNGLSNLAGTYGGYYPLTTDLQATYNYNPATSIDYNNNGLVVTGTPSLNGYIGGVITYNEYVPLNVLYPPASLSLYSMFGKQVCLSNNGTLLYVSAPSSDNPPLPLQTWNPANNPACFSFTSFTFDAMIGVAGYGGTNGQFYSSSCQETFTFGSEQMTSPSYNNSFGFTKSIIFIYELNLTDPTGWTYLSNYTFNTVNGMTMSCASMSNTSVYWNLNQNNQLEINHMSNLTNVNVSNIFLPNLINPQSTRPLDQYYSTSPNPAMCPSNRNFYIDHTNGNDLNNGQTPQTAWQTITHLNSIFALGNYFMSGDSILFCRGDVHYNAALLITATTNSAYYLNLANPNNCSLHIASYSCNPSNNHSLPILNSNNFLPQVVNNPFSQWQSYNWLALNQTTNYSVLRYNISGFSASSTTSLIINHHVYSLPVFPTVYNGGWNINSSLFGDNTCHSRQNYCGTSTLYVRQRWGPGNYCRQIVQGLFNGSDTLTIQTLSQGQWSNLIFLFYLDQESIAVSIPPSQSGSNQFFIGNFSCSWFMNKYIYPVFGSNVSMSDPFIDQIPLTPEDWYSIGQYSLPYWSQNINVQGPGIVLFGTVSTDFFGLYPPGSPPTTQQLLTAYWGVGQEQFWLQQSSLQDPQIVKSWFRSPCDLWNDGTFIYIYPCSDEDRTLLITNYPLNLINPNYSMAEFPQPNRFVIAYDFVNILEIQDLEIKGSTSFTNNINILSLHHNYFSSLLGEGVHIYAPSGSTPFNILYFYNNILHGSLQDCGPAAYVYILNNTVTGGVLNCNSATVYALIRGNAVSNGGLLIQLNNNVATYWTGIVEHNYASLGQLTNEEGLTNFGGQNDLSPGIIVRYNEFSNAYPGDVLSRYGCVQYINGAGLMPYGFVSSCLFLESNEWADHNILINCTGAGIYTHSSTSNLTNNLFINSNTPFTFNSLTFAYDPTNPYSLYNTSNPLTTQFIVRNNQRYYNMNFFTPSSNPTGSFPYCPIATNLDLDTSQYYSNDGSNLICQGYFDIVNTDTLSGEGLLFSQVNWPLDLLPYQSFIMTPTGYEDALTYWGNLNTVDYIVEQAFTNAQNFYANVATNNNQDFAGYTNYVPNTFTSYYGNQTCSCLLDYDLYKTRWENHQARLASEPNITALLLSTISNTYFPKIWPPLNYTFPSGFTFIGQWTFETIDFSTVPFPSNTSCVSNVTGSPPPLPYLNATTNYILGNNYYIVPFSNQALCIIEDGSLQIAKFIASNDPTNPINIYADPPGTNQHLELIWTYTSTLNLQSTNEYLGAPPADNPPTILTATAGCSIGSALGIQQTTSWPWTYDSNTMELRSCSSLCLTTASSTPVQGSQTSLETCNNLSTQKWLFGSYMNPGGYHSS